MEADIIFCIFEHLTYFDIVRYVQVNKQINNISKNKLIWKKLSDRDCPDKIDSEYIKDYRGHYKLFEFLRYRNRGKTTTKSRSLALSFTCIKTLPSEICLLTSLEKLYLHNNKLSSLPTELSRLTNLNRLDLDYNDLESIPSNLSLLTNLRTLYVDKFQVHLIPECVKSLPHLTILRA